MYITEMMVRQLLSVGECIEVLRRAFSHDFTNIPRYRLKSANSLLHVMSASIPALGVMGLKAYATSKTGAEFTVLLHDENSGALLAILEADALGQIRTGAASGLATDLLANPDAKIGAIIGTGFQAETQLKAIDLVRHLDQVRIFSRSEQNRKDFVERMQNLVHAPLVACSSVEACVRDADIISTVTSSKDPVLPGKWLKSGCHINAAGSNWAGKRELDAEAVLRAGLICVDHLAQSKIESGDLISAFLDESRWSDVVELTDVVRRKAQRSGPDQITLFKSNGIAAEDVAAAYHVYLKCKAAEPSAESDQ